MIVNGGKILQNGRKYRTHAEELVNHSDTQIHNHSNTRFINDADTQRAASAERFINGADTQRHVTYDVSIESVKDSGSDADENDGSDHELFKPNKRAKTIFFFFLSLLLISLLYWGTYFK